MLSASESQFHRDSRSANRLLARLPACDYDRIRPKLKDVTLTFGQVLLAQDQRIAQVVFPTGGAYSLTKHLGDGVATEVASVGNEGVIGAAVFFGDEVSQYQVLVEAPAAGAQIMSARDFIAEMSRRGAFYNLIVRYNQALLTVVMQAITCCGRHTAEQRCCRWLLMMQDHVESDQLRVTRDFLSAMLGVRCSTLSAALSRLQRTGIVATDRRSITILDRAVLEKRACECYRLAKCTFARLLPDVTHVNAATGAI
jgi:CRP-like cAMP-binding protein